MNTYKFHHPRTSGRKMGTHVIATAVAVVLSILAGCAHVKSAAINFGKCELGEVPTIVTSILPDVNSALGGIAVDWQQQLDSIGTKVGVDTLECAIAAIIHEIKSKKGALEAVALRKVERGQIYLAAHPKVK